MELKAKDEFEGLVDGALLIGSEPSDVLVEAMQIDGSELLNQHARPVSGGGDLRAEGRWSGAARGRGDDGRRKPEQGVGLHDDAIAGSALLTASAGRQPDAVDVAARHSGQSAEAASISAITA